eukprot:scaffold1445_cov235-Pinguiococcus_pyrenoidosus.AAC.7
MTRPSWTSNLRAPVARSARPALLSAATEFAGISRRTARLPDMFSGYSLFRGSRKDMGFRPRFDVHILLKGSSGPRPCTFLVSIGCLGRIEGLLGRGPSFDEPIFAARRSPREGILTLGATSSRIDGSLFGTFNSISVDIGESFGSATVGGSMPFVVNIEVSPSKGSHGGRDHRVSGSRRGHPRVHGDHGVPLAKTDCHSERGQIIEYIARIPQAPTCLVKNLQDMRNDLRQVFFTVLQAPILEHNPTVDFVLHTTSLSSLPNSIIARASEVRILPSTVPEATTSSRKLAALLREIASSEKIQCKRIQALQSYLYAMRTRQEDVHRVFFGAFEQLGLEGKGRAALRAFTTRYLKHAQGLREACRPIFHLEAMALDLVLLAQA